MRINSTARATILALAITAITATITAAACGPAHQTQGISEPPSNPITENVVAGPTEPNHPDGPAQEAKTATPEPTPTPTQDPDCYEIHDPSGGMHLACPPPGPKNIESNLRRKYNSHMATKEENDRRRAPTEAVHIRVAITTDGPDHVDGLVEFLEQNTDDDWIRWNKGDPAERYGSGALATVSIELLHTIAGLPGVIKVKEVRKAQPAGTNQQSLQGAADLMGATAWHAAGQKGAGVEVAIIDFDFRDFANRVRNPAGPDVKFLCFPETGQPSETDFSICERANNPPSAHPHGTEVAAAFIEIAPEATLYISNANDAEKLTTAIDWLTKGTSDNSDANARYNVANNDNFNVTVVNHSQGYPWDGPGDGTSPFNDPMQPSPLSVVDTATGAGTMWANSAGNGALRTWYKANPSFNAQNYLEFDPSSQDGDCNTVRIAAGTQNTFQARWEGAWENADIDLNAHMRGPIGVASQPPTFVFPQMDPQSGESDQYPHELFNFQVAQIGTPPNTVTSADYCLYISKDPNDTDPGWVQVQMFSSTGTLGDATRDGSIDNPAESANPGMLAVGASNNQPTPTLQAFSARGPAPEPQPNGRTKPELVAPNTNLPGTSFAAPRVAGLAALAIAALGSRPEYNEPEEIATLLKDTAIQLGSGDPNNQWGHGLAVLPSLEAPTNLRLTHVPCNRFGGQLRADFDHTSTQSPTTVYQIRAQQVDAQGNTGNYILNRTRHNSTGFPIRRDRGDYWATAQSCLAGTLICGPQSAPSPTITVPPGLCTPDSFQAEAGDGLVTLKWNPEPDATTYEIEHGDGTVTTTTKNHHVIRDLTNGTSYSYRVRAKNSSGATDWTYTRHVTPVQDAATPSEPADLYETVNISRTYLGPEIHWRQSGTPLYDVRIWDGVSGDWRRAPFSPKGWGGTYRATLFRVGSANQAIISGLIPGTEYSLRFRATREINSTNAAEHSGWSDTVVVKTSGTRPSNAPAIGTIPPPKMPPSGLTASVIAATSSEPAKVQLSWNAQTNPNYAAQFVWRRVAQLEPIVWKKTPIGLNDTSYTDNGTETGTTYVYRIRAEKPNQKGGVSNAVTVSTPP